MFFLLRAPARLKMTQVNMIIRSSLIFHPIPMKFWLKTTNIIYKNWINSHNDRIMLKISRHKNRHVTVKVPHPVIDSCRYLPKIRPRKFQKLLHFEFIILVDAVFNIFPPTSTKQLHRFKLKFIGNFPLDVTEWSNTFQFKPFLAFIQKICKTSSKARWPRITK